MFQRLAVYNDHEEESPDQLQGFSAVAETERAPEPIQAAEKSPQDILDSADRYFRIPFLRPGATEGCWRYMHFRGQNVVRQMELHRDITPVLFTAGMDDKQMCELSLKETGLTRKPWAEILEQEFLAEWACYGGANI